MIPDSMRVSLSVDHETGIQLQNFYQLEPDTTWSFCCYTVVVVRFSSPSSSRHHRLIMYFAFLVAPIRRT